MQQKKIKIKKNCVCVQCTCPSLNKTTKINNFFLCVWVKCICVCACVKQTLPSTISAPKHKKMCEEKK